MYKLLIRPLLFLFDAERIHHITFSLLRFLFRLPFLGRWIRNYYHIDHPALAKEVFGISFKNPVGLAAGFDKDARLFRELSAFGFGFIEIGTLTPKPQAGNPKRRLFRLKKDRAIINRMGFNNEGVIAATHRLKKNKTVLIGGNIGKNKVTSNEDAIEDYRFCFHALYDYVDYLAINVSSPNTPNLRALQDKKPLMALLHMLQEENVKKKVPKPILLKIAPDLTDEQLIDIISIVEETKIAGVIATNTTIARDGLISKYNKESGGLSGAPLCKRSTEVIRFLTKKSKGAFPVIAVGGIMSAEDAIEKLDAGADLVQVYTGFVYEGPQLIKSINKAIIKNAMTSAVK